MIKWFVRVRNGNHFWKRARRKTSAWEQRQVCCHPPKVVSRFLRCYLLHDVLVKRYFFQFSARQWSACFDAIKMGVKFSKRPRRRTSVWENPRLIAILPMWGPSYYTNMSSTTCSSDKFLTMFFQTGPGITWLAQCRTGNGLRGSRFKEHLGLLSRRFVLNNAFFLNDKGWLVGYRVYHANGPLRRTALFRH